MAIFLLLAVSAVHGYAVSFDIIPTVDASGGLSWVKGGFGGIIAIESQSGGPNADYTMVFTFANPVTSVGSISVTSGVGSVKSSLIDSSNPDRYIVNLTSVADAQMITVSLASVSSGGLSSTVSGTMGILIGDTNGDGVVNSADITQTKSESGQSVGSSNFRADINGDGFINSADITLVKTESGTAIPDPPGLHFVPSASAVPDSGSSAALLGLSLLGLALLRRRLASA